MFIEIQITSLSAQHCFISNTQYLWMIPTGVDFIKCFAPYLRLAPNFWEAFYCRRAQSAQMDRAISMIRALHPTLWNRPLVESCTLDAAAMRVRSLFTSFTFCNIKFSCSLISKERMLYVVPFSFFSLIEIPATINLY